MENFTPLPALCGGILIGLSVVLLLLTNGRIAGISGVVGGLLVSKVRDAGWRLAFIAGLIAAPLLYAGVAGGVPLIAVTSSTGLLIAGGFWLASALGSVAAAPAGTAWPASPVCRPVRS